MMKTSPIAARIALFAALVGAWPAAALAAGPQVRRVTAYPQNFSEPEPSLIQGPSLSAARPRFEAAPVPNRDVDTPTGPRATNDPQLAPSLFNRRDQYRGEGISPNSSAQIEQERRLRPGAGFTLKMPLQQ